MAYPFLSGGPSITNRTIAECLLYTHMGLSGPAILKSSLYWEPEEVLVIDFLPGTGDDDLFADAGAKTVLSAQHMPDRLAEKLFPDAALQKKRCAVLSADEKDELNRSTLHAYLLLPDSMAGLRQAEVCRGGVDVWRIQSALGGIRKRPSDSRDKRHDRRPERQEKRGFRR